MADASALSEYLSAGGSPTPFDVHLVPDAELHVPEVCDIEVVSALRRSLRHGYLTDGDARQLIVDYGELPLTRHRHPPLVGRMFELRDNFSAADAAYVALAERLGADLLTADRRLALAVRRHTALRCLP